jgi:predicted peptidase
VRSYRFEQTGENMEWALFVSSKVDRERPSPLVIALHGRGVGPTSILRDLVVESAESRGYIVAAPMGYNESGWFGIYESDRSTPPELREYSEADVLNVLAMVRAEFNVDENRIYIMGASMGGAGALYLARQHPDIWAAVGAGAPAFRESQRREDIQQILHMPVVLVHGDRDAMVDVGVSRRLAADMDSIGMTFEDLEIPGGSLPDAFGWGAPFVFDFFDRHVKAQAMPADPD